MRKFLVVLLLAFAYSGYYFPCTLKAFPIMNLKMIMAVLGLCFFVNGRLRTRNVSMRTDLLWVIILAAFISLWSFVSITYNNTTDYVYVRYFMSMATWLGGAYACITLTRYVHGRASIYLVFQYLMFVCAGHCILAILIDNVPLVKDIVDSTFINGEEFFEKHNRLYSFGVGTDKAGIRFSAVLVGIAYLIRNEKTTRQYWIYVISFIIIVGIGSMISRTTIVGFVLALVYLLLSSSKMTFFIKNRTIRLLMGLFALLIVVGVVGTVLYNTDASVRYQMRYGFEGFFNYFERGEWETHSSNLMFKGLEQLPTEQKTWIIGDGYFDDPLVPGAFYMGVDMGYVRFIYYFGLIGLGIFIFYFMYCTYVLCQRDSKRRLFFVMMFLVELGVWVKITTDIFCMFALLMLLTKEETDSDNKPLNPII